MKFKKIFKKINNKWVLIFLIVFICLLICIPIFLYIDPPLRGLWEYNKGYYPEQLSEIVAPEDYW
jgi:hypothetical protein